jgi:molybdopterin-guanine dinucleotide biosynthesis protein A
MSEVNPITGLILAGGRGRRMGHQDKGLIEFNGKPLICYGIAAMRTVTSRVVINANRHLARYALFDCPLITDHNRDFNGPLAGILAGMTYATEGHLLVMPCDTPFISGAHLNKLLTVLFQAGADAAIAFDGQRLHPIVAALNVSLKGSLHDYLSSGQRRVETWLLAQHTVYADFSEDKNSFVNLNTPEDLTRPPAQNP